MVEDVSEERLLNKIRKVRLLILDVDGVMTDGIIIIDDAGLESKHFDVRDGHGLKIIMRCGISVALLTGRKSRVVEHRAADHRGVSGCLEQSRSICRNPGTVQARSGRDGLCGR
jgi:3-deoxy-D-manno-octulosonate 8-phosphate phosphatase KdsC-like HAD superfamily phosphatase